MTRFVMAVTLALVVLLPAAAQDKEKDKAKKDDTYIKVEVKGTLKTGIVAIGGETTGNAISAGGGSFEVELDKKQSEQAEKLSGKTVIVTGTIYFKKGVTVRGMRTIIKADSLKEAK
jgi:hypothetical protein